MIQWVAGLPYAKYAANITRQTHDDQEHQGCMEGTREQILADLDEWAINSAALKVFWLNEMARTGKDHHRSFSQRKAAQERNPWSQFLLFPVCFTKVRDANLIIPRLHPYSLCYVPYFDPQ